MTAVVPFSHNYRPKSVVQREINTALVEAGDFGTGTSSRSTKLGHGGVVVMSCKRTIGRLLMGQDTFDENGALDDIICNCGSQRVTANVGLTRVSAQHRVSNNS